MLPLGIPDFVVGFGWVSLEPGLHGYLAAVMIMTLSLYPLVYLPVRTALARVDAGLEEAARSLGMGPWRTFWRVTLRQIRPAVLGGCLLVTLGLLAEYGAFEIVQYQTFTVAIFTEFKLGFDTVAACVLSLVLVALSVAVLGGELRCRGRGARRAQRRRAPRAPRRAGRARALDGAGPRWRSARSSGSRSACRSARSCTGWCAAARARCRRPRSSARSATRPRSARRPRRSRPRWRCPSPRSPCATATA